VKTERGDGRRREEGETNRARERGVAEVEGTREEASGDKEQLAEEEIPEAEVIDDFDKQQSRDGEAEKEQEKAERTMRTEIVNHVFILLQAFPLLLHEYAT